MFMIVYMDKLALTVNGIAIERGYEKIKVAEGSSKNVGFQNILRLISAFPMTFLHV